MSKTHDDFGFVKALDSRSRRGRGAFTPRNLIGRTILDVASDEPNSARGEQRFNGIRDLMRLAGSRRQNRVSGFLSDIANQEGDAATPASPAVSSRETTSPNRKANIRKYGVSLSNVDEPRHQCDTDQSGQAPAIDLQLGPACDNDRSDSKLQQEKAFHNRRLKRSVLGADGRAINSQTPSTNNGRPSGLKHVDYTPAPQKYCLAGSKRQFAWIHRPTAWNSTITYEDPPEPGKRPSHPVCAVGVVATDRMRSFPERTSEDHTSCLLDEEHREAEEIHLSETAKSIRSMKYPDTSWLTQWHWHPQRDIDPPKPKKFSLGVPVPGFTSARSETVWRRAAGKPGASDHYGPDGAAEEREQIPLTAR